MRPPLLIVHLDRQDLILDFENLLKQLLEDCDSNLDSKPEIVIENDSELT